MSIFPDTKNPEIALSLWEGNLFPGGAPQSVYTLNTERDEAGAEADGSPALFRLKPGQTYELPGGRGSITFDSVKRFAGLSVRTDPGAPISLVSAILATLGLILGLTIKRRRVFVRVRPPDGAAGGDPRAPRQPSGADGRPATVVTIGGLSKDSDPGLAAIVTAITPACTTALQNGPTAREPRSQRQRRALRVDDRLHARHARLHLAPGGASAEGGRLQGRRRVADEREGVLVGAGAPTTDRAPSGDAGVCRRAGLRGEPARAASAAASP